AVSGCHHTRPAPPERTDMLVAPSGGGYQCGRETRPKSARAQCTAQPGPGGGELPLGLDEVALRRGDGGLRVRQLDLTAEPLGIARLGKLQLGTCGIDGL